MPRRLAPGPGTYAARRQGLEEVAEPKEVAEAGSRLLPSSDIELERPELGAGSTHRLSSLGLRCLDHTGFTVRFSSTEVAFVMTGMFVPYRCHIQVEGQGLQR